MGRLIPKVHYIFLWLLCPIHDTVRVTALGEKYAGLENKALGHVFESQIAGSSILCCTACSQLSKCTAVNYFRDSGRCELNDKNPLDYPSSALNLSEATGVDVYHRHGEKCDHPWVLFDRHCYLFSDSYKNWTSSRDHCRGIDAELVDILDVTEDTFVREKAKGMNVIGVWIGVGNVHIVSPPTWTNGKPVTYTNFYPGEPNNSAEYCLMIYPELQYKWIDWFCSVQGAFACKKRMY